MKESGFSIVDPKTNIRIEGGNLWKAKSRENETDMVDLDEHGNLSIYLEPSDTLPNVRNAIFDVVRHHNAWLYSYFAVGNRLPSVILLLPISMTVLFIGFITILGDAIKNWVFLFENTDTIFGIDQHETVFVYGAIAVIVIYFFPVFLTGEQDGFAQAINERFSNRKRIKKRFALAFNFLVSKGHVKKVTVWNPDLSKKNKEKDWITNSMIPALIEAGAQVVLEIKTDERNTAERYVEQATQQSSIRWREDEPDKHNGTIRPIPYNYLEDWEKEVLAIYTFASTANLPEKWVALEGDETDGVLRNAVSLRLVEELIERFQERMFSEEDRKKLISLDAFASRCVNDFGILTPCLRYTNDVWTIASEVVERELKAAQEEMKYVNSFMQINIEELANRLEDPVSALVLNSVHEHASIYNHDRLEAVRFFVKVIAETEQYKILKQYWELVIDNPAGDENLNEDVYRIIGVDLLNQLATIFERAAMYDHAYGALDYLETIFPYRGKMGKARVMERKGKYEDSILSMLGILKDYRDKTISLQKSSLIDLNQNLAWAIVSGRKEQYKEEGWRAIREAQKLLHEDFDSIRNSEQTIRLYNIWANYEEWDGNPQGSLDNYAKALQIPGVQQAGLSNLFVNRGIALRQMKMLKEAAEYGEQGCEIKSAIGDADQLPIALHNLAQTYLELAFSFFDKEKRMPYFEKAYKHAQTGLDIQAQTGSVKKRGQLLTEKFIAIRSLNDFYGKSAEDSSVCLKAAQAWMQNELDNGRGTTYDCRVVVGELLCLMEDFNGKILEDAVSWAIPVVEEKE